MQICSSVNIFMYELMQLLASDACGDRQVVGPAGKCITQVTPHSELPKLDKYTFLCIIYLYKEM